jgi:hypothetical protein
MSRPLEKDSALCIRLPRELHEELRKRAAQEDRTIAAVIRIAAKRYLGTAARQDTDENSFQASERPDGMDRAGPKPDVR